MSVEIMIQRDTSLKQMHRVRVKLFDNVEVVYLLHVFMMNHSVINKWMKMMQKFIYNLNKCQLKA